MKQIGRSTSTLVSCLHVVSRLISMPQIYQYAYTLLPRRLASQVDAADRPSPRTLAICMLHAGCSNQMRDEEGEVVIPMQIVASSYANEAITLMMRSRWRCKLWLVHVHAHTYDEAHPNHSTSAHCQAYCMPSVSSLHMMRLVLAI